MNDAAQRPQSQAARGSGARPPEPRFLAVGQVVGVHGVRGELKVEILTDDPGRLGRLRRVYVGREEEEPRPTRVAGCRLHKGRALIRLAGCDDRDSALALRGCLLQVPLAEASPLGEGEYYEHQILGLAVWTVGGELLGEVVEILYTGANDVYVVHGPGRKEILIPAIANVVLQVDLEAGRLVVELPEGLR